MGKPWILMYMHKAPYPLDHGTAQRIWQMVQHLRKEYQIGIVLPEYVKQVPDLSQGVDGVWVGGDYRGNIGKVRRRLSGWLAKFMLQRRYSKYLAEFAANPLSSIDPVSAVLLERLCLQLRPITVMCQKVQTTVPAAAIARRHGIPVLLDVHDVLSVRHQRAKQVKTNVNLGGRPFTQDDELALLNQFDGLIAIQPEEASWLGQLLLKKRIIVAPHPPDRIIPPRPEVISKEAPILLYVGSKVSHNADALQYFLTEQFPTIREAFPAVKLQICGSICERVCDPLPNVQYLGICNDLQPFYDRATLVINPVRFGSGLKIKTVEALAQSKCLVTTPIGAEGYLSHAGKVFVCSSPEEMGKTIVSLLNDLGMVRRYELAAYAFVLDYLSPEICYRDLMQLLQEFSNQCRESVSN